MSKKILISLLLVALAGVFIHFYKLKQSPACLNSDEVAFGYNAYSLLKTGKDEYGTLIPVRLKSFADFKMPLITYLTIPWIAIFGLNEFGIKFLNAVIIMLLPISIYLLSQQLFKNKKVSLLAALLSILSWGIQSLGRQLHEALPTSFLITCSAFFFVRSFEKNNWRYKLFFFLSIFLSLFSYQSSRIFAIFFFIITFYYVLNRKLSIKFLFIFVLVLFTFGITDIVYKPKRVSNLLFFNNAGFSLKINELRGEGGSRLFYNKLTVGIKDIVFEYLKYFSPQFLVINGDENPRFGYSGLSPITFIEYLFFLVGIYYLFKNKERYRFYIMGLVMISPISASLSWATGSLTRSFFILIPILLISSYGVINFVKTLNIRSKKIITFIIILFYIFFIYYNWDFYINHYPKRALVIRAWECGYKQLTSYIKDHYDQYDQFYITRRIGQPYMFLLFYLKFPPEQYQKQARLLGHDQYGFGWVEKFDKFIFTFRIPDNKKRIVIVGYPDDFTTATNNKLDLSKIKKIKIGSEEIFWIAEVN